MKVAIDITSTTDGHQIRGVGSYTRELFSALNAHRSDHTIVGFTSQGEIPFDASVIHYPYFDPFGSFIPVNQKAKIVVTVHDFIPLLFPAHFPAGIRGQLRWQVQRLLLPRVEGIIAVSGSTKHDCERFTGIKQQGITTIYSAASDSFLARLSTVELQILKKKYDLPDRFLLYVGDATWNKNLPRLIEAAALSGIPLVMAGKALVEQFDRANRWNDDLIRVDALTRNNTQVHKIGYVPEKDLLGLYQLALMLTTPSLYEGFGFPVLEAMMAGCPVLTSKKGAIPEIAGDAAFYVDPESVASISQGITDLANSVQRRKRLVEKGMTQYKKFSWQNTARLTLEYYEQVAAL